MKFLTLLYVAAFSLSAIALDLDCSLTITRVLQSANGKKTARLARGETFRFTDSVRALNAVIYGYSFTLEVDKVESGKDSKVTITEEYFREKKVNVITVSSQGETKKTFDIFDDFGSYDPGLLKCQFNVEPPKEKPGTSERKEKPGIDHAPVEIKREGGVDEPKAGAVKQGP